ncbi:MAG: PRC-barrel domain-containing protein [Filifactoraceae bacterium]
MISNIGLHIVTKGQGIDLIIAYEKGFSEVIGEVVITVKGNKVGEVKEVFIDEEQGKIIELWINGEEDKLLKVSYKNLLTLGYDVIVVSDTLKKVDSIIDESTTSKNQIEDGFENSSNIKGERFIEEEHIEKFDLEGGLNSKGDLDVRIDLFDELYEIKDLEINDEFNLELSEELDLSSNQMSLDIDGFLENDTLEEDILSDEANEVVAEGIRYFEGNDNLVSGGESNLEAKVKKDDFIETEEAKSSGDVYKNSLITKFIERQKEVLIGKSVVKDIIGKDGNVLIEKGQVITLDVFEKAYEDRNDSVVELAMFSE